MRLCVRLAVLIVLAAAAAGAQSWTGYIVDAKCYDLEERNMRPTDTETYVDRDVAYEIRVCHPTPKSKTFVFFEQEGLRYRLDAAGNAKVAEFVHANGKRSADLVSVSGTKSAGYHLQLDSISLKP